MSDNEIQFEEDDAVQEFNNRSRDIIERSRTPRSVLYLLENGVVRTKGQATALILVTSLLFLGLSGWIATTGLSHPANLYVTNQYGQEIPFEIYVQNIKNGDDPLNYQN